MVFHTRHHICGGRTVIRSFGGSMDLGILFLTVAYFNFCREILAFIFCFPTISIGLCWILLFSDAIPHNRRERHGSLPIFSAVKIFCADFCHRGWWLALLMSFSLAYELPIRFIWDCQAGNMRWPLLGLRILYRVFSRGLLSCAIMLFG